MMERNVKEPWREKTLLVKSIKRKYFLSPWRNLNLFVKVFIHNKGKWNKYFHMRNWDKKRCDGKGKDERCWTLIAKWTSWDIESDITWKRAGKCIWISSFTKSVYSCVNLLTHNSKYPTHSLSILPLTAWDEWHHKIYSFYCPFVSRGFSFSRIILCSFFWFLS